MSVHVHLCCFQEYTYCMHLSSRSLVQGEVFASIICILVAYCAGVRLCMHIFLYHFAYVHVSVSLVHMYSCLSACLCAYVCIVLC